MYEEKSIPIVGLRMRRELRKAMLMILNYKRCKNPDKGVFFYDLIRDACVDFIENHPEYHEPTFDFQAFKKDYYGRPHPKKEEEKGECNDCSRTEEPA